MQKFINNLPCYSISPLETGNFEIALVDYPAIEEEFLKFDKEGIHYEFNSDKQNVKGSVMIPNFPIYRSNPPRYVVFSEESIIKCQSLFFKNGSKFNIDHSDNKVELEVIESKINKETDEFGQKGAWILEAHISDNKLWGEIKDGKFNGFSIESMFIQFNNDNIKKNQMTVFNQIKELVNSVAFADEPMVEAPEVEAPKEEDKPEEPDEMKVLADKIEELSKKFDEFSASIESRLSVLEGGSNAIKEEMSKISIDLAKFGAQEVSTPVKEVINTPVESTNKFEKYFSK